MKNLITLSLFSLLSISLFAQPGNLIAHYPFDNGIAVDLTQIGGDGTIQGNPIIAPGVIGDALYFDGGNHSITFSGPINNHLKAARDFTISFMFKSDDPEKMSRSIMGKRHICKGVNMFDIRASRKISMEVYETERPRVSCNVGTRVDDLKWHHYVFIKKKNTTRLYKDGTLVDQRKINYVIGISDLVDFKINGTPCKGVDGTRNMKGYIDELRIFDDEISPFAIEKLFENYKRKWDRKRQGYAEQSPRSNDHESIQEKNYGQVDPRMNQIFGSYADENSLLLIEQKTFQLKINKPEEYKQYDQAILSGKYKIEGGRLTLIPLKTTLTLNNGDGSVKQAKEIDYQGDTISGDIYDQVIIDLYALETRLKFRKS